MGPQKASKSLIRSAFDVVSPSRGVNSAKFAGKIAVAGTAGWALENTLVGPRYSVVFEKRKIPFLPVYAFGGAASILLAPKIKQLPWYGRAGVYALVFSGIEYVGCLVNRRLFAGCSWDYSKSDCQDVENGCVDLKHAAAWGILGLATEGFFRS